MVIIKLDDAYQKMDLIRLIEYAKVKKKEDYENIIKIGLDNGADFVEIFDEYSKSKSFILNDSKLDTINSSNTKGIGIRVIKNNEVYYSSTNIVTLDNLKKIIVNLTKKLNQERSTNNFKLNNLEVKLKKVKRTFLKFYFEFKECFFFYKYLKFF